MNGPDEKKGDFEDDTTGEFADSEPTNASRPPVTVPLPGDLAPEELRPVGLDDAFDRSEVPADLDRPSEVEAGPPPDIEGQLRTLVAIVESLLFAADKPLTLKQLGDLVGEQDLSHVREAVASLEAHYHDRGVQLQSVAGGHQFRTHPRNATWVQKLLAQKPVRLSRALLETLAIVSYRQPITRPEIDEIRGVDSGGTLKTLMDRALVRILGKKEEPGRPMLYGTTREFLEFFNLKDLKDLPTLREFHELSEEHRAQVEALESAAPAGAVETEEEARLAEAARRPLERVQLEAAPADDARELEEIDQLIEAAGKLDKGATLAPPPEAAPTSDGSDEHG
jgi:segregation and condensation protein B